MDSRRVAQGTREMIESSADPVLVSYVSLWELAIKVSTGKLRIDLHAFAGEVERLGFAWAPLSEEHAYSVSRLRTFRDHRDPFDRMLVAQAISERATFLTADARLARYGDFVQVV